MANNRINWFHDLRRLVFASYEKYGLDKALEILKEKRIPNTFRAGLHGEIIFYEKFGSTFALEPLLDAGVKADFSGQRENQPVNFDVTTNIDYKDINNYIDVIQKRKKMYEIVLVNPKSEEVLFYPLRFPICPSCNKFSHYFLYLVPPIGETYWNLQICDEQTIIRYCSHCGHYEDLRTYHYEVRSLFGELNELKAEDDVDGRPYYSSIKLDEIRLRRAVSTTKFFEKTSTLLLSGLAENEYHMTDRDGGGYWRGALHWKHPLVRDLKESIDVHYGEWEPSPDIIMQLLKGKTCNKCGKRLKINPKLKIGICQSCSRIYKFGDSVESKGYELKCRKGM